MKRTSPPTEDIRMISNMVKKGGGGVIGGRGILATVVTSNEPLMKGAGGVVEGRGIIDDVVVTEPSIKGCGVLVGDNIIIPEAGVTVSFAMEVETAMVKLMLLILIVHQQ